MRLLRTEPRPRVLIIVGALAVVALMSTTAASYTTSTSISHSIGSATLAAPTGLSAAHGSCAVLNHDSVNLTWTATTSTWAGGQQVYRATASGGPFTAIGSLLAVSATSYTDSPLSFGTTYWYLVAAIRNSWRTDSTHVSITTKSVVCV